MNELHGFILCPAMRKNTRISNICDGMRHVTTICSKKAVLESVEDFLAPLVLVSITFWVFYSCLCIGTHQVRI